MARNAFLIDTDIFIDYLKSIQPACALLDSAQFDLYYSSWTRKELLAKPGLRESERQESGERGQMSTREQNEKKFRNWDELAEGGRRYWLDVVGRLGWRARYLKDVDDAETTLRFWQEIYDDHANLVEVHEKYPVDKGHQKV